MIIFLLLDSVSGFPNKNETWIRSSELPLFAPVKKHSGRSEPSLHRGAATLTGLFWNWDQIFVCFVVQLYCMGYFGQHLDTAGPCVLIRQFVHNTNECTFDARMYNLLLLPHVQAPFTPFYGALYQNFKFTKIQSITKTFHIIQGQHKVFPWLQTTITIKLLYVEYMQL